jgi:LysR family transcriptional regulator, hydrogen peroxide-inducible genes activator
MLVALPYDFKHVETLPLFKDHFLLAHRKQSKWITLGDNILTQLKTDSVLLLEDGHCLREHTLSACQLIHTDKINQFSGTSIHTLLHMVNNDLGVTFIPEMAKQSTLLFGAEIELASVDASSYREIGLVWRQNSSQAEEFHLLGDFIRASMSSRPSLIDRKVC